MASHYFRQLPDIGYRNPTSSSTTSDNYVVAKNLFLRTKIRDDIYTDVTFLQSYTIKEGVRPMDVAEELYGSQQYDWIVLTTANILNVRTEWPMNNQLLYDYCLDKYGVSDINATAYYETTEVKDAQGRLILPAGKIVDSNFTIRHPDTHNITLNPVIGVSNHLSETRNNEKKRHIKLMRKGYLSMFLMDMRDELKYAKSSQFVTNTLKKAHNPDR